MAALATTTTVTKMMIRFMSTVLQKVPIERAPRPVHSQSSNRAKP
jgi:hypothetical protein